MEPQKKHNNNTQHSNGIVKEIALDALLWPEHITEVDLSNRKIVTLADNIQFPPNLIALNISKNELTEVPSAILSLKNLRVLNISYNKIMFFDDTPKFCELIEKINLSHNKLAGPPYWVWSESPSKLNELDISHNPNITESLKDGYYEELINHTTSVINIKINNCVLGQHLSLLNTFANAKKIQIGSETLTRYSVNRILEVPCEGLDKCCTIESLNLGNTQIYTVKTSIGMFTSLVEINLSQNYISSLPTEFCNLQNLEVCVLSFNQLLYLPDDIGKLKKLTYLSVESNELCMLPDSIVHLQNLTCLDLYDNCLYEVPEEMMLVSEIDIAQNYINEPEDEAYIDRKEKLRLNKSDRFNGRKSEAEQQESEHSNNETDDEELLQILNVPISKGCQENKDPPSSPEDWDSDDYWVPRYCSQTRRAVHSPWLCFVKRKMEEGNFCPMDVHPVSIAEKVKYEKLCHPKVNYESDGQFDDISDENS